MNRRPTLTSSLRAIIIMCLMVATMLVIIFLAKHRPVTAQTVDSDVCLRLTSNAGYFAPDPPASLAAPLSTRVIVYVVDGNLNMRISDEVVPGIARGDMRLDDSASVDLVRAALDAGKPVHAYIQADKYLPGTAQITSLSGCTPVRLFAGALSEPRRITRVDVLRILAWMRGAEDTALDVVFDKNIYTISEAIFGANIGPRPVPDFSNDSMTPPTLPASCSDVYTSHPLPGDTIRRTEHDQLMQLANFSTFPPADVVWALRSGNWSNAAIWSGGAVPGGPAVKVCIPLGIDVRFTMQTAEVDFLRIDGNYTVATDRSTQLKADTIVVTPTGKFTMGTVANPVPDGITAEVIFTDKGAIDTVRDPIKLGRGLVAHGPAEIHGADVTPFVALDTHLTAGQTVITLRSTPQNWEVGDTVVFTALVKHESNRPLERVIRSITGNQITVDPVDPGLRIVPSTEDCDCKSYVANLTRNIVFRSENTATDRRGHVMFMHTNAIDVQNASFIDLGRTDTSGTFIDVLDPSLKGRYPVHFHRSGNIGQPGNVQGIVIIGSPSVGLVNHGSNANFFENIIYRVRSVAIYGEVGIEAGEVARNLMLWATPLDSEVTGQEPTAGIFTYSGNLDVHHNIINGYIWGVRIDGGGYCSQQQEPNTTILKDAIRADVREAVAGDRADVACGEVPPLLRNNEIFAVREAYFTSNVGNWEVPTVFDSELAWNIETGYTERYSTNDVIRNSTFIAGRNPNSGFFHNAIRIRHIENTKIIGFNVGLYVPESGRFNFENLTMKNTVDFAIYPFNSRGWDRHLLINNPVFGDNPNSDDPKFRYLLMSEHDPAQPVLGAFGAPFRLSVWNQGGDNFVNNILLRESFFHTDEILVQETGQPLKQLFSDYQEPSLVIHDTGVPQLDGLTNQQAFDTFNISMWDQLTPPEAVRRSDISGGKIGNPITNRSPLNYEYANVPNSDDVRFIVRDTGGPDTITVFSGDISPQDGWNVTTGFTDRYGNARSVAWYKYLPVLDARLISSIVPETVSVNEQFTFTFTVKNRGSGLWGQYRPDVGLQAGTYLERRNTATVWNWGLNGYPAGAVPVDTPLNETVTFSISAQAPSTPGLYAYSFRMGNYGVLFGDTIDGTITVNDQGLSTP